MDRVLIYRNTVVVKSGDIIVFDGILYFVKIVNEIVVKKSFYNGHESSFDLSESMRCEKVGYELSFECFKVNEFLYKQYLISSLI